MSKIVLPYKVNNRLKELIKERAKQEKKTKGEIEVNIARYCGLTVKEVNGQEVADAIKKYKYGLVDPSLPIALKIAKFFNEQVESIFKLEEV